MKIKIYFIILICLVTSCGSRPTMAEVAQRADKKWIIDEYTIYKTEWQGPVGPITYRYEVFKGEKYLTYGYPEPNDSCDYLMRERGDFYVRFNLCDKTKTIYKADKKKLDIDKIDLITIRPFSAIRIEPRNSDSPPPFDTIVTKNFDSTVTKTLTKSQIKSFAKGWNNSGVNGFERLG